MFFFWGGGGEGGRKKVHYVLGGKRDFHIYEHSLFSTSNFIPLKGKVKIEPHWGKVFLKWDPYILVRTTSFEPSLWSADEKADPHGTSLTWSTNMNEWIN